MKLSLALLKRASFDLPSVQTLFDAVKCHFESFADSSSSSTLVLWIIFVVPEGIEAKWKREGAKLVNLKLTYQILIWEDTIKIK